MKQWLDALESASEPVVYAKWTAERRECWDVFKKSKAASKKIKPAIESLKAAIDAAEKAPVSEYPCRSDGRCQYAD